MTELRVRNPLVNWQELDEADPGDEHDDVTDLFDPAGRAHGTLGRSFAHADAGEYQHVGFATAVPISVPGPLTVKRSLVEQTCPGRSRLEARQHGTAATPRRVCVQALIDAPGLPEWPGFYMDNGHLPYRVPDLHAQAAGAWRHIVNGQQREGRLILTARDTNTHGPGPSVDPAGVTLTRPVDAIDKVVAVPAGPASSRRLRCEVIKSRDVRLTIDGHDAKGLLLRLTYPPTRDALILWVVTANIGRKAGPRETRANIALVRRGFRR